MGAVVFGAAAGAAALGAVVFGAAGGGAALDAVVSVEGTLADRCLSSYSLSACYIAAGYA